MKPEIRNSKFEIGKQNRFLRAWRLLRATPAQKVAVDAVLGGPVVVPPAKPGKTGDARFDEVERVLSLALDAVINAVDAYRERKKGGL